MDSLFARSLEGCSLKEKFMLMLIFNNKSSWVSKFRLNVELQFISCGFCTIMLMALSILEVCFMTQLPFTSAWYMQQEKKELAGYQKELDVMKRIELTWVDFRAAKNLNRSWFSRTWLSWTVINDNLSLDYSMISLWVAADCILYRAKTFLQARTWATVLRAHHSEYPESNSGEFVCFSYYEEWLHLKRIVKLVCNIKCKSYVLPLSLVLSFVSNPLLVCQVFCHNQALWI